MACCTPLLGKDLQIYVHLTVSGGCGRKFLCSGEAVVQ